jgi:hypothetical protein
MNSAASNSGPLLLTADTPVIDVPSGFAFATRLVRAVFVWPVESGLQSRLPVLIVHDHPSSRRGSNPPDEGTSKESGGSPRVSSLHAPPGSGVRIVRGGIANLGPVPVPHKRWLSVARGQLSPLSERIYTWRTTAADRRRHERPHRGFESARQAPGRLRPSRRLHLSPRVGHLSTAIDQ